MKEVTQLELELLLLFYNFSDQHGIVDVKSAKKWANQKLGVHIPDTPFTLTQKHVNLLINKKIVPDTRDMLTKIFNDTLAPPKK